MSSAGPDEAHEPVLDVRNLSVRFTNGQRDLWAVRDVSFRVARGQTLALVGESGSGKSMTSLALMGLTPPAPSCRVSGEVRLRPPSSPEVALLGLPARERRRLRGAAMSVILQEPMTSLNPVHLVGAQIAKSILFHQKVTRRAAMDRA